MRIFFGGKFRLGFTIVELLVVITIISLLMAVAMASIAQVRENTRDKQRVADLAQIKSAIELYAITYNEYPCENASNCNNQSVAMNGRIGEGGDIDSLLSEFMTSIPVDPLGPGDSTHYYYIDPRQACGGNPNKIVIFARAMETNKYTNSDDTICSSWGGEGGAGSTESYMIVIGDSTDG